MKPAPHSQEYPLSDPLRQIDLTNDDELIEKAIQPETEDTEYHSTFYL